MILLIGGVGYAGKTCMAQRLLEKYKFPYLSIDHLKMGLYRANIGCGFTPDDSAERIGEKLWPILKSIIMTNIENKQNLIIEGGYLLPDKIQELEEEYRENILTFYLLFSKAYIERYFESKVLYYRNAIEIRNYENCDTIADFIFENENQKKLCERYHAVFFEIQDNHEKEITSVYTWIDNKLSAGCHGESC